MNCASYCVLAIAALALPPAMAETEAEYLNPGPWLRGAPVQPSHRTAEPARAAPRPAEVLQPKSAPRTAKPASRVAASNGTKAAGSQATVPVQVLPRAPQPAFFAAAAAANVKPMPPQQREEWRFLKDTAAASRYESEAARLALARSSNPEVRSFAATLINHHTAAGNDLLHMLHVRGMAAPMLANDQRKTLNHLAKLQGAKFDREFLEEVGLKDQQADVESFERASAATRDPQLKGWIDRTLPTLRWHLTLVERTLPAETPQARAIPAHHAGTPVRAQPAVAQQSAPAPYVSRASLATRSMGAPSRPAAARSNESSTR